MAITARKTEVAKAQAPIVRRDESGLFKASSMHFRASAGKRAKQMPSRANESASAQMKSFMRFFVIQTSSFVKSLMEKFL